MKRRELIQSAGSVLAATALLGAPAIHAKSKIQWKMVTTWPRNFPGLGTGAQFLANIIGEMSDGELEIKVYGAGELVPAFEVFDAVSSGTAQMGHGATYYWKGKHLATQFFSAVPFGLTAQEANAWLYHGGGLELWQEVYDQFGLIAASAGNTGTQMAGWFNKEINSVVDLTGLKMRIPGFGASALKAAGGTPVALPGGEIFQALQSGTIDATEWVGPYNDLAFGLYKAAKYYYYPGWHEPGTILEVMINQKAFQQLPHHLQKIVRYAARVATEDMLSELTARNGQALDTLVNQHHVQLRRLPQDVLQKLADLVEQAVSEESAKEPLAKKIHASFLTFRNRMVAWENVAERAFLNARAEVLGVAK